MARFGDFTLLEDLGTSAVADRHKATHATLGGPFFLKIYRRLPAWQHPELARRGDALIGVSHPHLAPHMGHGVIDGVPFVVSPWLDGLDLEALAASLKDRRVNLTLDHCLLILADLTTAITALHHLAPDGRLAHGDLSIRHVRVGPDGQIRLTGLVTPRGLEAGKVPDLRFDLAGVGALLYDLVPLLRGGAARPPLPTGLDRIIRRALAIGPPSEHLSSTAFGERLAEVFSSLKLSSDKTDFVDIVQRTQRALEKKAAEARPKNASDGMPELIPVTKSGPILEPMPPRPSTAPTAPASPPWAGMAPPVVPLAPVAPVAPPPPPTPWSPTMSAPSFLTGSAARPATPPPARPATLPQFVAVTAQTAAQSGGQTGAQPPPQTPPAPSASPFTRPASPFASPPSPFAAPPSPFAAPPPAVTTSPAPPPFLAALANPAPPSPPSPFAKPAAPPMPAAPSSTSSPFTAPSSPPALTPLAGPVGPVAAALGAFDPGAPVPIPTMTSPFDAPSMPLVPPIPFTAPTPAAPRPATMPSMPSMPPVVARKPLLADADEGAPAFVPPPLGMTPLSPTAVPTSPTPAPVNPALNERTDPDATKPLRIEAQKALPAVKALIMAGLVTSEQVEQAAVEQAARGGRTIEILVAHGWCTDAGIADVLARASGQKRIADGDLVVKDRALLKRLPQTYALARRLLPLTLDAGTLVLAVADPYDQKVIDEVRDLVHALDVDVWIAGRAALTSATMKAFADLHGAQVAQSGPRVLLCIKDDEKAQQLGSRLAQEGMQVEHVVDGVTARTILQTRCPDAVICTFDLPGVDGQGLLLAARHGEKTAELPVFIIGPRSDDDLMAKVLDLGADDYFGEPVRPDVVVAKLRRAINKSQGRPSQAPEPAAAPPPSLPKKVPSPTASQPMAVLASDAFSGFDDMPDLPPEFDNAQSPDVPAMPTGVMGTLRQMSLPEIVQSLEMGRKTASVDIVPQDGEKGAIGFETGAIKFAECGSLVGDQAFFALMRHKEGFFRIHYGDAPKSMNIDAPTTFLLLEAMRLMDEEGIS